MFISYKQILKQAGQIAMHNKFLWVFGAFAAFVSLENVYEIVLSQISQARDPIGFYQNLFNLFSKQATVTNKSLQALDLFKFDLNGLLAFIIFGAVMIFLIWLAVTSQVFIIKSTSQIYRGKKVPANLTFNQSDDCFIPVLSLQVLTKLVLYGGFIGLSLPLLYFILTENLTWLVYLNIVFFIIYIIFSVLVSFLAAYATNFIVLKNLDVIAAISAAWKVFKKNVLISIEIATILFFLKLVSLIIILSLLALFVIPLAVFLLFSLMNGDLLAIVMILTILILVFTLISLFINALFTTFYLATWTLTFIKITEDTLFGKILSWANNLPAYIKKFALKNRIKIDEKKIKAQAAEIAKEADIQARKLSKELSEKYVEYKPTLKKQGQKLVKQSRKAYAKYQPIVKKESLKMAKDIAEAYKQFEPMIEKKVKKILSQPKKQVVKKTKTKKTTSKSKLKK